MPRFYFEVQAGALVQHDTSGIDVADPLTALHDCLDVLAEVIASEDFDDLRAVTITDERHDVIATINVEAIRRTVRQTASGAGPDDDTA
jgi:hypothetical protein